MGAGPGSVPPSASGHSEVKEGGKCDSGRGWAWVPRRLRPAANPKSGKGCVSQRVDPAGEGAPGWGFRRNIPLGTDRAAMAGASRKG